MEGNDFRLSRLHEFFSEFIETGKISLKDGVIQEEYVFTSIGLVTREEFDEAVLVVAESETNEVIPVRQLQDNQLYQLKDGTIVYHIGMFYKNIEYFNIETIKTIDKHKLDIKMRYFIEMEEDNNKILQPKKLRERKSKDVVVKAIYQEMNIDHTEKKVIGFFNYSHRMNFAFTHRNMHGFKEVLLYSPSSYSLSVIKYEKDYFLFRNSWDKNFELYKIKDFIEFKSRFYDLLNSSDKSIEILDLLERTEIKSLSENKEEDSIINKFKKVILYPITD